MLCFNRWAGWRLLGYKTGTGNLLWVVLNWMLVKFMDIHWPRQTRKIQTCLYTLIIHPTDQRVHLSTQRKFKAVSPSISLFHSLINFIHTHISTHICRHIYICMHSYISQCFYTSSKIKIFPNSVAKSLPSTFNKLSFTSNKNYKKILHSILFSPHII